MQKHIHSTAQRDAVFNLFSQPNLDIRQQFYLLDELTAHGFVDRALRVAAALKTVVTQTDALNYIARVERVNHALKTRPLVRRSVRDANLVQASMAEASVFIKGEKRPDQVLVVFATLYNNFNLSFPVLHGLLRPYGISLLIIKCAKGGFFLHGAEGYSDTWNGIGPAIATYLAVHKLNLLGVMGHSSGGYPSLYAAGQLAAPAYAGFGIRTDIRSDSLLPGGRARKFSKPGDHLPHDLVDLQTEPLVHDLPCIDLYYGALDASDVANAEHMASLSNVHLHPVANSSHTVILSLLAEGLWDDAMARLLGPIPGVNP